MRTTVPQELPKVKSGIIAFANVLPLYKDECIRLGCDSAQVDSVDRMINRVHDWRMNNQHRLKRPDAKGEKLLG